MECIELQNNRNPASSGFDGDEWESKKLPNSQRFNNYLNSKKVEEEPSSANFGVRLRKDHWCRNVSEFEILKSVGDGAYGHVSFAKDKNSSSFVALKKIKMEQEKEGFPITALREYKMLSMLRKEKHQNIVNLKEVVFSGEPGKTKSDIYFVFDYVEADLSGLIGPGGPKWHPSLSEIKCLMKQLLESLHCLHKHQMLHRDIKPANILISANGILKLADFGLSRQLESENNKFTPTVVTLWYRAPEILLGSLKYGAGVDIWAAGCILAELLLNKPLFPGNTEAEQIGLIFELLGTPDSPYVNEKGITIENEFQWKAGSELPLWKTFNPKRHLHNYLHKRLSSRIPPSAIQLLHQMLTLDPSKRISAMDALHSDFFWETTSPACSPSELPIKRLGALHEWEARQKATAAAPPPSAPIAQPQHRFGVPAPPHFPSVTGKRGFDSDTAAQNKRARDNHSFAPHAPHHRYAPHHPHNHHINMNVNLNAHHNPVGVVGNTTATIKGSGVPGGNLIPGVVVVPGKRVI